MNNILHWRKSAIGNLTLCWWDEARDYALTLAVLMPQASGRWLVGLPPGQSPRVGPAIHCRSLHEAADCARRWAEYRGFRVESRFPEGGGV